jgi:hypothetical protein
LALNEFSILIYGLDINPLFFREQVIAALFSIVFGGEQVITVLLPFREQVITTLISRPLVFVGELVIIALRTQNFRALLITVE